MLASREAATAGARGGASRNDPVRGEEARFSPSARESVVDSRRREPIQRMYQPEAAVRLPPAADDLRMRGTIEGRRSAEAMTEAAARRAVREYESG